MEREFVARKFVPRDARTGRFITSSQVTKNPENTIFEEKGNGKTHKYRLCAIQDGKFVSGNYMLLEPVTTVAKR